jgi:hypothetical protein
MQRKLLGIINVDCKATGQLFIYSAFIKCLRKMGISEPEHQLYLGFKKDYDSVEREVFYNSLIESGNPIKLATLNKWNQ